MWTDEAVEIFVTEQMYRRGNLEKANRELLGYLATHNCGVTSETYIMRQGRIKELTRVIEALKGGQ